MFFVPCIEINFINDFELQAYCYSQYIDIYINGTGRIESTFLLNGLFVVFVMIIMTVSMWPIFKVFFPTNFLANSCSKTSISQIVFYKFYIIKTNVMDVMNLVITLASLNSKRPKSKQMSNKHKPWLQKEMFHTNSGKKQSFRLNRPFNWFHYNKNDE